MKFDEAVTACAAVGWSLTRDAASSDDTEFVVTISASRLDNSADEEISHTSRTAQVEGSRWNAFNADQAEATALLTIVSRVVGCQLEQLQRGMDAVLTIADEPAATADLPIS